MKYIIFAALLQVIVTFILLFSDRKRDKADNMLALLLLCIGSHLLTKFYIFNELGIRSVSSMMHTFIQLSYGPLLYLYATKKQEPSFVIARNWYLFIPLIVGATLYSCIIVAYYYNYSEADLLLNLYNKITFFPIVGMHIVFGALLLIRYSKRPIPDSPIISGSAIILILVGLTEISLTSFGEAHPDYSPYIRSVLYALLGIFPILIIRERYVIVKNVSQTDLIEFTGNTSAVESISLINPSLKIDSLPIRVERKLLLEKDQHKEIYNKIEDIIRCRNLYRDEEFSLEKLVNISGFNRHYLSETLNVYAKKSFYQYINECRISEVIRILDNTRDAKINLLSIAYDSGFKNKASFNNYFKKTTGLTPSEYLKTIRT